MAQPLNYQLSFGGEKIPEPAPVKKETLISGSTPDQIKLVSGIAQNWVTDYLKSENPEADVSSLGEINYNPNLPVFDNAFPAINDQTDFKALGLEDENGKVTTKGEQYAELKEMGIITQFGGLSNHGKALLMSEDDALLPENIDIFRAREDIGMYKGEDVGVLKQIGDLSTELAAGVRNIVVGAAQYGLGGLAQIGVISDENKAADIAGGVAAIDAFTTGMAKLPMMSEGIVDSLTTLVATQMADSEDIAMVQAQHRQDVLRKASLQADYSFLEQVAPIIDYVPQELSLPPVIGGSIEGAKQTMGDTNYAEFTQPIQSVSQFSPMLLQGPLVPLGLAIQPEMLAIHATQTGATKLWAAAAAPAARAAFRAGETAKIVRQLEVDASILNAQQSIAITKAEKASNLSASLSEKANTATFTGDVVGSKAAADVAARADALAKSSARYAENIGGRINNVNEQIAKFQNAYGVADRTLKIADTFRKWPTAAGMVAGWPLEQLGKGLIATRKGVDAVSARTDKIGGMIRLADKVSGLGVGAVGSVFNPMLAVPAAAKVVGKGVLALGPVIKGVGSFTRVMGEAASERAASIPFWQKVANFENINPTQRMLANGFSEFAVAGGYLKRVGSNYAKTYPAFLGLEYLHSGDLETAAKNAIAPTIVIGAPGALLGSAIAGSRSNLRNLAHQDMLNFRSRMDTDQRQKFDSMDSGVKRVIANVAESQPGVKFDFTDTGRGRFEESTYTVFINPNSRSPLRPVVTHEFLHYITEAGGATNSINHLLFGNEIGTGGLLKSVDGKYDKDYLRFKVEYIKLQEQDDAARRRNGQQVKTQTMDDAYLGMEYFVETQVDRLLRISESGELSRLAGKTQLQRLASKKINELADSMMSRGAFLENLAMRMGSLRDNKGEYVMGNGILADGVRDMPEMRNLFNKLISETSGRRPNATKSMDARSTLKTSQGREIPITDKNDPMIGSMYSDFVFDGNGVVKRDQYGNPERISNDRKKSQESIGLSVADLQAKRIQSGEALLPGELRYDPQAKEWVGEYLTPEQIDVIRNSGFFEQPFIDSLDLVNGAARRGQGEVVNLSYSAATKRNKKMGPSYFSGGVTLREISPIQVRINKAGGIYVKSVDVLQLRANINEVARSKDGARVYEGDVVAISNDVNAVMKLHANGQPTDAYFAKYGAEAQTRKKLINSVFGKTLIDKGINEFSSSAPRSVIKDFRIDRFGKSVLKKGTDGVQVNHKFVRINYLPEGPLRSNDAGDVVIGNPELKAKIEERNRKLGLPPSDGFADATEPADISPEDVNPIQTRNEAERLFADGKQLYAFNEMDGTPSLVTSLEMLQNYPVDSLGYVDNGADSQPRYLPESLSASKKKYAPSDETELKAFASATKNKRSGELAVAAVRLDKGIISNEEFSNMVEIFDPFVVKGVEAIPSIERVKKYIVDRSSGRDLTEKQKEKIKKVKENLDIAEGELVDYRIDIPTYNVSMKAGEPTYAITGHKPGGSAKADEVIGYTSIARIKNVKVVTRVEKGNPMTIAQGGGKFPLATVRGNNVKINRLPADINDPKVWSEIAYNPSRSSEFVDVRTKMPVQSADDAIMVGSRVFMKNPVYDSKPNYGQPRVDASGKQTGVIDKRYLPEGLPKNYQSNKDETYLRASIGNDGLMNIDRPFKSTEALPTVSMRHDYSVEDFKVFNFDKKASVVYAKNKNGVNISFKFDPLLMNQPEFADFDTKYKGMVVQLAMADRHGATDGDMGGHLFPDLKVNQDNIVTDENGKEYKIVWANNAWGPVANMSSKAQKFGAVTLLTYNMDPHAHDSNTRTVRIFSNEIANSGLSIKDQSTILIVQNVALKKFLTSASKKDLRALVKVQKKLINDLKIDDRIISGSKKYPKVKRLSAADREALLYEINDGELLIKDQEDLLKEALGAKDATVEEMKVDKLFRDYQTKRRASEKTPKSEVKAKAMKDAEKAVRDFQKTKEFKLAESLLPSRELDQFSYTFNGRKSLIKAIKTKDAAVKWGSFDALKISEKIGDQMTGDSMSIVSSVELSSDPNFKAVYLGEDSKEIARMTPSEKLAADKLKSNPNFVSHEAYQWAMLGPAESKHYFNTNQRSVLDSFPSFLDEYSKLPVKEGKLKLNDPKSKASEFNKVNTIRDQSKIKIVYGGTDKKQ